MKIMTEECIFEILFRQIQIEITGKCNMKCKHCRASQIGNYDMPLEQIESILSFGTKHGQDDLEIVLSGGEPLLHQNLEEIFSLLKKYSISKLVITTNGSISIEKYLKNIKKFDTVISVSLDSISSEEHNAFRGYEGAFEKAIKTLKFLERHQIKTNVRMSIVPKQIQEIEQMVEYVYHLGVRRFSISSIIPTGKAAEDVSLCMNQNEKKVFLEKMAKLKKEYEKKGMILTTSDPLKNIFAEEKEIPAEGTVFLSGCTAGIDSFNVNPNGQVTPCAMLDETILNLSDLTLEEIEQEYKESEIVKNLVARKLKGKCENCKLKYQCGGCRTRAKNAYQDYLQEDCDCWKEEFLSAEKKEKELIK